MKYDGKTGTRREGEQVWKGLTSFGRGSASQPRSLAALL